ncbi:hypothetical protein [uncultured Aquabacterium sp.]|uniref:hypothetical protein n=1 Tax=uncultured Aquabacterium sp. TaxID=158753 RepID=UPI0025D201E7|nr:hypothetical protein [uncultured Aquabacterium sp.]
MWTWIVALAWMYVASLMALAEATDPQGTVLGAIITFLFYGVGPLALLMYLLSTPARRQARRAAEAGAAIQRSQDDGPAAPADSGVSLEPDASGLPTRAPGIPPERKEP